MSDRETWTSRVGFILAAVGSAVGLGNIWSFPFQTASNGGAAFLVVYLCAVFLLGFPVMLGEFVIGRRSERNAVEAFRSLGFGEWSVVGGLAVVSSFVTLAFYSVVGGWVLSYIVGSVTGGYLGDAGAYFGAVSAGPIAVGAHAAFMALTIGIVALGVTDGIERATKLMVPAIFVLMGGLAVWVSTFEGAAAGYAYYLSPDVGVIADNIAGIVPPAVGQAFFTLSLGFGVMIAYSSYLGRDDSLPADGSAIVVVNTLVALIAGFVVFPVLFAIEGSVPDSGGAGTAFTALAGAFSQIPGGQLIGLGFFVVLLFAALSSSISLLEVPTAFVADRTGYDRTATAVGLGAFVALAGVPTALDTGILGWYNDIVFELLLPLAVLSLSLFVGWVADDQLAVELNLGSSFGSGFSTVWLWWIRIVIPVAIGGTLLLGIQSLLVKAGILAAPIVLG
ncbi:sodium-dependent transporter [Halobaculum magnesiiphilum]|uniref:Sodium-dependent transporter n=1 Tax=Halobaculum magnesiiphilum TaxID=1017351 RepID=A0A8T8WBS7_9EURY|nr:sodium-dependent transporter [Halobaculum magnesiiphilum]QZP37285.1 sodium-dependent transporter [Halobaculum magnesiiphilum]